MAHTSAAPKRLAEGAKRRRCWPGVVILLVLFTVGVTVGVWWAVTRAPSVPELHQDPNVKVGSATLSAEERLAELNKIVEESNITFSINSTPMYSLSIPDQGVNWVIENPPDNGNRFTVTILLLDTGETVYQTNGYLDPEQYIETGPLLMTLPKGEYRCVAYFDAYRIDDNSYIGQGGAELTLYIVD